MNKNIQILFEKLASDGTWSSRYGPLDSVTYNFISRRDAVKQLLKNNTFSSVLDLGCGTGDYVTVLSNYVTQYVGVDFVYTMVKKAKDKYNKIIPTPFFGICCAERLPFKENVFDLITAIGFIEYFDDPKIVMQEIIRVLKPRGTLIVQSWKPDFYQRMLRGSIFKHLRPVLRELKKYLCNSDKPINKESYVDIPYSKDELDCLMKNYGFYKIAHSYSNFAIFPQSIRKLFPKVYIILSEVISRNKLNLLDMFAINYIGFYILDRDK